MTTETTAEATRVWGNFIGGTFAPSATRQQLAVRNPATGETLAEVAHSSAADVDRAVDAATTAFHGEWGAMSPRERGKLLRALGAAVDAHREELAELETRNVGKPIRETSELDIPGTAACFDYYGTWADKLYGETIPNSSMPVLNYTIRQPLGVVGAIVPWNGPLSIGSWKVAPALAAGNTVVLKPAGLTPLSMLRLAELAQDVGIPAGVFNVVTGPSAIGDALVTHPGVAKVSFTGSTSVGQTIMSRAAPTMKALTLECGGKSANIVFGDADLDAAVEATLFGIFLNQGEVCAAGSRLLVQSTVHEEFLGRLVERAGRLRVGDPLDATTQVGALISRSHLDEVHRCVEAGVSDGARLLTGGEPLTVAGLADTFYTPTILDGVDNGSQLAQQEVFGPVLAAIRFETPEQAVQLANDNMYGLSANIHTTHVQRAHSMAARLQAGSIFVNLPAIPFAEAPFGGLKMTGLGKDLGRDGIEGFTFKKSVVVSLAEPGEHFRWYA
ncbi:aldehyde dehydrogenase family protein [Embleya scabrispora]|uniref:aldehyde dehydrogenase family protein n=1 Tax=Embleya scabrispora TaxID=159449 RepID=UPI000361DDA5|nr:aldehyde dehydrogenase family protein [Embleya scabrispora]MYS85107.1 aldehyde dehydrogenase family protein [Streptomyces sp. SID5474]